MSRWSDIIRATNAQILTWAEAQPWARAMAACQQDAQWHAEGDVWTHTRMVCAELERLADWPSLDRATQLKLLFTALFHDAGKPATTVLDPDTGRIRSPRHALAGAEIARRMLRELECGLVTREEIAGLVRFHGRPPFLLAKEGPEHEVISLSWQVNNQGAVVQSALEQCREHLRAGRDFAFNATNITRQMRGRWIEPFADYNARIEIVYLEPPLRTILMHNQRRTNPVPEKVIEQLLERLEPPTITECHALTIAEPATP